MRIFIYLRAQSCELELSEVAHARDKGGIPWISTRIHHQSSAGARARGGGGGVTQQPILMAHPKDNDKGVLVVNWIELQTGVV
jgi:hypothetical protein